MTVDPLCAVRRGCRSAAWPSGRGRARRGAGGSAPARLARVHRRGPCRVLIPSGQIDTPGQRPFPAAAVMVHRRGRRGLGRRSRAQVTRAVEELLYAATTDAVLVHPGHRLNKFQLVGPSARARTEVFALKTVSCVGIRGASVDVAHWEGPPMASTKYVHVVSDIELQKLWGISERALAKLTKRGDFPPPTTPTARQARGVAFDSGGAGLAGQDRIPQARRADPGLVARLGRGRRLRRRPAGPLPLQRGGHRAPALAHRRWPPGCGLAPRPPHGQGEGIGLSGAGSRRVCAGRCGLGFAWSGAVVLAGPDT